MFLGSTTVAAGASASASYRSHDAAPPLQGITVSASTVTAQAAVQSGLSGARQIGVSATISRRVEQSGSGAGTGSTIPATNRMTVI